MRGFAVVCSIGAAVVLAALSVAPVAFGQGDTMPPGVLPAEEAAAGWINLFDKETTFGWNILGDAPCRVVDGILTCEGGTGGLLVTTSQFADYELQVKLRISADSSTGLELRSSLQGHYTENGTAVIPIAQPKDSASDWHTIAVTANGPTLTATLDGAPVEGVAANRLRGYIGIQYHGHGGKLEVSEAKLKPLNLKPIFNGTDLTGWNIIPDHKSEFSVIEGALNIKKGNGQIETAGEYKDFVLQLDIFSNGDHLNSGVFYRGPVGVFWKGYESQVRNEWDKPAEGSTEPGGIDRRKPHDFGTGGNYGNQKARMVVSSDREWFHKTIVCDGNHAAVWINGYQTSDFTDTRPVVANQDGKAGYVPGPGTIHLQGHDPTTDLSFKNINIMEYPARGGARAGGGGRVRRDGNQ
ncbi:MAG: DUF1080 domain-containing protein [Candidatus Hydrogenedentes bacterium]|nr:DUF1080 domain-containing protein [Candidatus Hydrogenedentota bacterium]